MLIRMKISARNMFKGKVKRIETGAVNCEVVIELPGGLKKGGGAYAVIKASSVLVAVD